MSADERGQAVLVFTGKLRVYRFVPVCSDLTYKLGNGSGWVKHQSSTIWGEIDGAFWPLGLRAYCVTFLNEKWMGGEMKLTGVERATAEAVDKIPPPHLTTLTSAISSTQLCAHETGKGRTTRRERRQGQAEVALQIGHSPQETIINKAVTAQSPLKEHWRATSLNS